MKSIQRPSHKRRYIIALITATLLIAGGLASAYYAQNKSITPSKNNEPGQNKVNYDPPTTTDEDEAKDHKESLVDQAVKTPVNNSNDTKKSVEVGIVDASQYGDVIEVRAFTPGVVEGGGVCTATFTKGSLSVTETSEGFVDATTTQCSIMNIPRANFPSSGTWSLVLAYESSEYAGRSTEKRVEIK